MKSKMTPGDWRATASSVVVSGRSAAANVYATINDDDPREVCVAVVLSADDARAIACLPELVEAARMVGNLLDSRGNDKIVVRQCVTDLRRILARIEGES